MYINSVLFKPLYTGMEHNIPVPGTAPPPPPPPPPAPMLAGVTGLQMVNVQHAEQQLASSPTKEYHVMHSRMDSSESNLDDGRLDLGPLYKQNREARLASQTVQVTNIQKLGDQVTYTTCTGPQPRIGGFENDSKVIASSFLGTRMNKGLKQVNECIASSFDPSNLSCIMCSEEHNILQTDKPAVICVSDQTFVPCLSKDQGNCISVVRLEDAGLTDLTDLVFEIFDKVRLPEGTVLLLGSGSHLLRVGASAYAYDWLDCVARIETRWREVNVCPLVPVWTFDCPGSLARDLGQLAIWFSQMYLNSTCGLHGAWSELIGQMDRGCSGGSPLATPEVIKLPMPSGLKDPTPRTFIFQYNSSCPALLSKLDCKAIPELVRALICSINNRWTLR